MHEPRNPGDSESGRRLDGLRVRSRHEFTALALESLGRSSLGEGALEWTVADADELPVLDPRRADTRAALTALRALAVRPIRTVDGEVDMPDRARLDRAVSPALAPLLPEIHRALVDSCARRQKRAGS